MQRALYLPIPLIPHILPTYVDISTDVNDVRKSTVTGERTERLDQYTCCLSQIMTAISV
jgi:hypothetical protein